MRCIASKKSPRHRPSQSATSDSLPARKFLELAEYLEDLASPPPTPFPSPSQPVASAPEEWAQHLVDAFLNRLVTRFPKPGSRCPYTGLDRSQLYELMAKSIDGQPAIQTVSLKGAGHPRSA
jgi:hypothetical protein